jgi:CheY-like chemotaxis protein
MLNTEVNQPVNVLLIDDNPGDVRLTYEALRENRVRVDLHVAKDGVEAIEFLRQQGPFESAPRPALVLMDLNMPRMNGREVLAEIKNDPSLLSIPVVVLTTSQAEYDVRIAYNLHANCYITKPVDLDEFLQVVKSIGDFWLSTVRLPSR